MRRHTSLLALMSFMAITTACGEGKDDTAPPEGDADTDSDADSDADSDSDSDADADADSDADSDTDTDPSAPPTLGVSASAVLIGVDERDRLGELVAGQGDLDGDGFDDVLVFAEGVGTTGALFVFGGPFAEEMTASGSTASLEGSTTLGRVETAVIVGDTNNDGFDDFVVGSEKNSRSGLYLGPVTGPMGFDDLDAVVSWSEGYDSTLTRVSAAGDVDGNGTADLILDDDATVLIMTTPLVGVVDGDSQAWATLDPPQPSYYDPCWDMHHSHHHLHYRPTYERDGESGAIGDLDGDGFGEVIVTNRNWNEQWWTRDPSDFCEDFKGIAYVVQGPVSGTIDLASAALALDGEEGGRINGDAGPMGDANGDGVADFFVEGGELYTDFVVFGPLTTGGFIGDLPNVARITGGDFFSLDIAGAGDVNGDGLDDLVTGVEHRNASWRYGAAIMLAPFSGTRLVDDAEYLYRGEGENSWAGASVSSAGDVDADGLMDVIVGAANTLVDGEFRGKAYLFFGADL